MNKPIDSANIASVDLWIAGRRRRAMATRSGDVTNPATGAVVRKVPFCNAADVDAAVKAAAAARARAAEVPPAAAGEPEGTGPAR